MVLHAVHLRLSGVPCIYGFPCLCTRHCNSDQLWTFWTCSRAHLLCVDRWIAEQDKELNTSMWLKYTVVNHPHMDSLTCSFCTRSKVSWRACIILILPSLKARKTLRIRGGSRGGGHGGQMIPPSRAEYLVPACCAWLNNQLYHPPFN